MKGINHTKKRGGIIDSVIKLNYIFTISENMIKKVLFSLAKEKKEVVKREFIRRLED